MALTVSKYNLSTWQGSTWGIRIIMKNQDGTIQDLTGYSVRMQIRASYRSSTAEESLTSDNNSTDISIDASTGTITFQLSAARTAAMSVDLSSGSKPPKTVYVYDIELQDSAGVVSKILYGDFTVYGEVTR